MAAAQTWPSAPVLASSLAFLLLLALSLLSTMSFSFESAIVLQPGSPIVATIDPYEVYEILVPVDSLLEAQTY